MATRDLRLHRAAWWALLSGLTVAVAGLVLAGQLGPQPDWSSRSDQAAALMMVLGSISAVASIGVLLAFHRRFRTARVVEQSSDLPRHRIAGMEPTRFVTGAVFYGVVMLACASAGIYMLGQALQLSRYGVETSGSVVSATCGYRGVNSVDVNYRLAGVGYRAHVSGWSHCAQAGDTASLIVDSRDPTDVSEAVAGVDTDWVYGVGCLVLALGSGWMLVSLFRGRLA